METRGRKIGEALLWSEVLEGVRMLDLGLSDVVIEPTRADAGELPCFDVYLRPAVEQELVSNGIIPPAVRKLKCYRVDLGDTAHVEPDRITWCYAADPDEAVSESQRLWGFHPVRVRRVRR